MYLSPAGEAGLHAMSIEVLRHCSGEFFNKPYPLWAWADKAHIASEHIIQLWELIEACLSEKSANAGSPGIILHPKPCLRIEPFSTKLHRAELVHNESPPVKA